MTVRPEGDTAQGENGLALVEDGKIINPLEKFVGEQDAITITLGLLKILATDRHFRKRAMGNRHTNLSQWAKDYLTYYDEVYDSDKAIGVSQKEIPYAGYIFHEGDPVEGITDVHGIEVPPNLGELLASDPEDQMREIIRAMVIARRNITAIDVARNRSGKEVTPEEINRSVELRIEEFMKGVEKIREKQTLTEFLIKELTMTETWVGAAETEKLEPSQLSFLEDI